MGRARRAERAEHLPAACCLLLPDGGCDGGYAAHGGCMWLYVAVCGCMWLYVDMERIMAGYGAREASGASRASACCLLPAAA